MISILGGFLTLSVSATTPQAGLPPTGLGLDHLDRRKAIQLAMWNNLSKQIAEISAEIAWGSRQSALGAFDWSPSLGLSTSRLRDFTGGADTTVWSRNLSIGVSKLFEWGGSLSSSLAPTYSETFSRSLAGAGASTTFPYDGRFSLNYTQPLLRNFGQDVVLQKLQIAEVGLTSAELQTRLQIIDIALATENLYWDYVAARDDLAFRQALLTQYEVYFVDRLASLTIELGRNPNPNVEPDLRRQRQDLMAGIKAVLSQSERDVSEAEVTLAQVRSDFLQMILPDPNTWPKPEELFLTERFSPEPPGCILGLEESLRAAEDDRLEISLARMSRETASISAVAFQSLVKPQVDLTVGYVGNAGARKTSHETWTDVNTLAYPGYSVSLVMSLPLGNNAAIGNLAQARGLERQQMLNEQNVGLNIRANANQALKNLRLTIAKSEKANAALVNAKAFFDAGYQLFINGQSDFTSLRTKGDAWDSASRSAIGAWDERAKAFAVYLKAIGAYEKFWKIR